MLYECIFYIIIIIIHWRSNSNSLFSIVKRYSFNFLNDQTFHFAQASSPYVQITDVVVTYGISNTVVLEIS